MNTYENWTEEDTNTLMKAHKWWFRWYFFKRWIKSKFPKGGERK